MIAPTDHTAYQLIMQAPIGALGCVLKDGELCSIDFISAVAPRCDPVATRLRGQLEAYFNDAASPITFPLRFDGTPHQQRVWALLQEIPPGEVRTYGDIARELGSSARAVGNACRCNPIPVVVPCHRVVAARGIGGYTGVTAGPRLERKRWLLAHEGVVL